MPSGQWPTVRPTRRTVLSGLAVTAAGLTGCLQDNGRLPAPIRGDPGAEVTVVAFADFACPHCREFALSVVPDLESEYLEPGTVRYEFHDFPVPVEEPVSWEAANAAREVQQRGGDAAFWEYERRLFENQRYLHPDLYADLAAELDLDGDAVRAAAVDRSHQDTIQADREMGESMGVRGTPAVFVDGEPVAPTAGALSDAIESAGS